MPDTKPAILFVIPWELHYPGGVNEVVRNLCLEARSNGLTPIVLQNISGVRAPIIDRMSGIKLITFQIASAPPQNFSWFRKLAFRIRDHLQQSKLRKLVARENVKLINVHYAHPAVEPLLTLSQSVGVKLVLSLHGADLTTLIESKTQSRAWRQVVFDRVDRLTTCSMSLRDYALENFPETRPAIEIIHNGISPDRIENALSTAEVPTELENKEYLLNIATFERKKGQDVLLKSFLQIARDYPDLSLVMIGRDGEAFAECEKFLAENRLQERVFLYKNLSHSKTMKILSVASMFVLPSREEPFGIVLAEAGYLQIPTMASRSGGISELLDHGSCGILVEPDDSTALTDAIATLLGNPDLRAHYIAKMKTRVNENFLWSRQAKLYFSDLL